MRAHQTDASCSIFVVLALLFRQESIYLVVRLSYSHPGNLISLVESRRRNSADALAR